MKSTTMTQLTVPPPPINPSASEAFAGSLRRRRAQALSAQLRSPSTCMCTDPRCGDNDNDGPPLISSVNENVANVVEEEEYDDDILTADTFSEVQVQIAMDSGCGKHVSPPSLIPGYKAAPSVSSRQGRHFIGAGGDRILNHGEVEINLCTGASAGNTKIHSKFQVADVTRMLMSVSQVCDNDCTVQFDKHKGWVTDKNGKVTATFPRVGGLYVAEMTLKNPNAHKGGPKSDFLRPGVTA